MCICVSTKLFTTHSHTKKPPVTQYGAIARHIDVPKNRDLSSRKTAKLRKIIIEKLRGLYRIMQYV